MKTKLIIIAIALIAFSNIAIADKPSPCNKLKTVVEKIDCRTKEAEARAKSDHGVSIGMTAEQVVQQGWGKPSSVNRTTTGGGTHEQWVYNSGNYLYFDNGILTAIQNH